jgi:hypothetical protein
MTASKTSRIAVIGSCMIAPSFPIVVADRTIRQ